MGQCEISFTTYTFVYCLGFFLNEHLLIVINRI